MRRRKRGSILTKILTRAVVLGFVIYTSITLIDLHSQIVNAEEVRAQMELAVEELQQINESYQWEIENRYDPETIERIARDRFGLVMPGERTFYAVSN